MKTKTLLLSLIFSLLLVSPAFANDSTHSGALSQYRQDKKELKEDTKQIRQENKSTLSQLKKTQVDKIYNQLKEQLAKRFAFLEASLTKIDKKVLDKKAKGITIPDLTTLQNSYNAAKAKYNTDLTALNTQYQSMLTVEKPLTLMPKLREAGNTVRTDLHDMQKALVDMIRLVSKAR